MRKIRELTTDAALHLLRLFPSISSCNQRYRTDSSHVLSKDNGHSYSNQRRQQKRWEYRSARLATSERMKHYIQGNLQPRRQLRASLVSTEEPSLLCSRVEGVPSLFNSLVLLEACDDSVGVTERGAIRRQHDGWAATSPKAAATRCGFERACRACGTGGGKSWRLGAADAAAGTASLKATVLKASLPRLPVRTEFPRDSWIAEWDIAVPH